MSQKNKPSSEGFNTHSWGFQGDRWENVHFESKPRHVTPQMNHLRKSSPTLRVSTHIYGVTMKIDGKNIHFESKPMHVTPQIDCVRKTSLLLRILTDIYGVSKEMDGKTFNF